MTSKLEVDLTSMLFSMLKPIDNDRWSVTFFKTMLHHLLASWSFLETLERILLSKYLANNTNKDVHVFGSGKQTDQ